MVGVPPGILALGTELTTVFNTRYPDAAVPLLEAPDRELARRFEQGELDLVLLRVPEQAPLHEGPERTVNTLAWSALAVLPSDGPLPDCAELCVRTTDSALFQLWHDHPLLRWRTDRLLPAHEARDHACAADRPALALTVVDRGPITPSASTIADRSYPLVHRIVVLHRPREKDALHAFHTWLLGEDGQRVVLRAGLVPGIPPERRIEVVPGSPG